MILILEVKLTHKLALNATHFDGEIEFNLHPLSGLKEIAVTSEVMRRDLDIKDPFILTRNSYPGAGRYSAKWTGDNNADWTFLYLSIPGIINYQVSSAYSTTPSESFGSTLDVWDAVWGIRYLWILV